MSLLHRIILGLAATLAFAGGALASEPLDTQSATENTSSEHGVTRASGQPQPAVAARDASKPVEAASEASTEDAAAAADASAEAVTEAVDETVEQPQPRDWTKASRKEVAAYNATVEPDHRIVCRVNTSTATRTGKKLCLTTLQWREIR